MLEISKIEKYDSKKMYKVYDEWPKIARQCFEIDYHQANFEKINHIVFAGMGGSGSIGDVVASILSKTNIHVNVVKGYLLPQTVDVKSVVVVISVSGNTVETLSILNSAQKIGCKIIAFSSGGMISEYCQKNKIEHRLVPFYNSPRASFTAYLYTVLKVLHQVLGINKSDIDESINKLDITKQNICSRNLSSENLSLILAEWISGSPIIYHPFGLQSCAIRFKNSLQENAKMHASVEDIIEFCHNGIVAWERPSNHQPVLIQGVDDYIKTKERWKIIEEFFVENKIDFWKTMTVSGSILTKIINLIYLLDYSTIYKAVLLEVDPSPVNSIDYIKKRI